MLISHDSKVMLKILQSGLQQYVNLELPDVQAGFRKGRLSQPITRTERPTPAPLSDPATTCHPRCMCPHCMLQPAPPGVRPQETPPHVRGLRVHTQPDGELQDRDAVPAVLRWGRWVTLPEAQRVRHRAVGTEASVPEAGGPWEKGD